jgi:hypothetical protein
MGAGYLNWAWANVAKYILEKKGATLLEAEPLLKHALIEPHDRNTSMRLQKYRSLYVQ